MPFFKTTHNILFKPDEDESYDENLFDAPFLTLPETLDWSYEREMKIEDVELWEVIAQRGGNFGIYAAWKPYAEFYLVTIGTDFRHDKTQHLGKVSYNYNDVLWETYYGPDAQKNVKKRAKDLGIDLPNNQIWVEEKDMWKYTDTKNKKIIIP
jgi:hypothetical protein